MRSQLRLFVALIVAGGMLGSLFAFPGGAWPTPGLNGEATDTALGRVFPEPLNTNDYVGYHEARAGLELLDAAYPDLMEIHTLGPSFGWPTITGGHATYDVFMVEVTNEQSEIPFEEKAQVLFMLSIHGNEKGGREGGLRVIEDLVKGIGLGAEPREGGTSNETYSDVLDYMVVAFLFPNPDGWAHDEPEHVGTIATHTDQCTNSAPLYCRSNGNGVDLNREAPTMGWVRERHTPVSEPESRAYIPWVQERYNNLKYASDIHGMLQNDHFVLTLLPAGSMDPQEMLRSTRAAELLKDKLNNNGEFAAWTSVPDIDGLWGGQFNEWGTVWDTIGYVDSGFSGDWFAQSTGLNAPGFDIELAYNHITFDAHYVPFGMVMNYLHVESVRDIMATFIDSGARDVQVSVTTEGTATAYLVNPYVATNTDDEKEMGGWAAENEYDDMWDYEHIDFTARPSKYFEELAPFLRDGDLPGILDPLTREQVTAATLDDYDNLIVPGSAIQLLEDNPTGLAAVQDWVAAGGNLVLTDSALRYLEMTGLAAEGSIDTEFLYAGFTNFVDRTHPLVSNIRGISRQTYEPVPLGFDITARSAPNWYVDHTQAQLEGLDALGWVPEGSATGGGGGLVDFVVGGLLPDTEEEAQGLPPRVNLGLVPQGEGTIHFLGSLLPDPSEEFYHPYGLDHYSTTYTGNNLLRNFLGWDQKFEAPPLVVIDGKLVAEGPAGGTTRSVLGADEDDAEQEGAPGVGVLAFLAALGLALLVGSRRRE